MADTEAQGNRIEKILGADNPDVSDESLQMYRSYLQKNIKLPCELTGIEDFRWEEYYILGPGDKKEYEQLKKTQPSYQDIYTFISFDDLIEDMEGLMVKVKGNLIGNDLLFHWQSLCHRIKNHRIIN